MKKSRKSFALNSIAVLSVAGIFGGLGGASAFAATPTTTPVNQVVTQGQGAHHFGPQGGQQMTEIASILKISPSTLRADLKAKESIADIAQKQGVSTATLTSDLEANFQAQLNKAVSSGKMTAAQEQKMITQFDAHVGDMINGTGFMGGGHHFGPQGGQQMTEIASILKISPSTLRADLKAKESIADIAQKQGVSTATLTSDLEANFQAQLNKAVSSGKMTAAQEQKMITQFDAHVGDMINSTGFMGGGHHFGPQGGQQMKEIASILKISPSTLRADLKAKESIADIAQKQGVSTATLTSDLEANFQAQLNKAVSSGKMTAAQEQKMITQFDAHVGDMINGTGFMGGGHHFGPQGGQQMTEIASILKISPSTLRADLKAKESIADIAQKQGVSTATLTSDLEANFQAQLNKAVSSGKMTAAQEQKMITQFDAHVGDMINSTGFMGGWHADSSSN